MNVEIKIEGMMCKHCVAHVEKALSALPSVASVEVDLAAGTATVVLASEVEDSVLSAAIVEAGYEVVEIKRTK